MREVIATGKTVEEATEAGCTQLGLSRDEVSVEILEMPSKKLFKTLPAKVRITAEEGEEPAAPAPSIPKPAPAPAPPVAESTAAVEVAAAAPVAQQAEPQQSHVAEEPEVPIDLAQNAPARSAAEYLEGIFRAMGVQDVRVAAFRQGDATMLRVEGGDIAEYIETRGETVQALSYLTDRAVNKGVDKKSDEYLRVRLDVAGYRGRRETELVALAERTAAEVVRNNRSRTLAPMNPYERLIVHTTISKMDGVKSESIGADTERRVVVKSTAPGATEGEDWRPPRKGGNHGGGRPQGGGRGRSRDGGRDGGGRGQGGGGRGQGGGRDRDGGRPYGGGGRGRDGGGRPQSSTPEREYADKKPLPGAEPVVPQRREAISDGDDLPLYGKIEL